MRLEDGFLNWVAADPSAPAVVDGDDRRSYGRLHQQAADLAGALHTMSGGEPARVGVFAQRDADAYSAMLGVLLAGCTQVPINPLHPRRRTARTIELADLDLIVADDAGLGCLEQLGAAAGSAPVLTPWRQRSGSGRYGRNEILAAQPRYRHQPPSSPEPAFGESPKGDQPAYILFTSGSTGDPKGVPISHGNVASFLDENIGHYGFGPGDRCSQTFDLTFDLSVFDLFMAWGSGACVYPLDSRALMASVDFVADNSLSVWFSVPSVAAMQLQRGALRPGAMPSLHTSLFCGEALTADVARSWSLAAPNSVGENLYGPTELTIACTRHRWTSGTAVTATATSAVTPAGTPSVTSAGTPSDSPVLDGLIPIGRPYRAMAAHLIDEANQPISGDGEGELCLAGPQQFSGYWRAPELSADRMIRIAGADYYRTGDRVRRLGGLLHFVGRLDNQVQVLGHRVELGEVEAATRSLDDVVEAVAFGLPYDEPNTTHLAVAVTTVDGSQHTNRTLRRAVADLLPAYMRPRRIELIEDFPLNANGKIDRWRLAEQLFSSESPAPARAGA